ncbi:MAG TPA: peptidoglycan-binding protein [Thermoanaerobaculia bacterium]|nr:peptidoglycan-binding protein [Thermoanaerobaculia bacterium]
MADRKHVVAAGECIASIGYRYGFFPATLWDLPQNAKLKELRGDGNVLQPGDEVVVPELRPKWLPAATGKRHRFRWRGVPTVLKLRLLRVGKPRPKVPYRLEVDGRTIAEGTTDDDGRLEEFIPPNAKKGRLVVDEVEMIELQLGSLQPVTTDAGVRGRLANLRYLDDVAAGEEAVMLALIQFQRAAGLDATGVLDDTTRKKLTELAGR